jgi:cytochrome oxidase Cu insertion factor (SCO1/SenC/PrrC family)
MSRSVSLFSVLIICLLMLPMISMAQYTVGTTVPNFTLHDVDGTQHNLYDYMGEVVLLNFYTTW